MFLNIPLLEMVNRLFYFNYISVVKVLFSLDIFKTYRKACGNARAADCSALMEENKINMRFKGGNWQRVNALLSCGFHDH